MDYNFDNLYNLPEPGAIKSAGEGRDIAQQWQGWQSEQSLSYGEVASWQDYFEEVAAKYPELREEFQENAII